MGVSDIATVRFSLPSQLLEPVPNLGIAIRGGGGAGVFVWLTPGCVAQNTGTTWIARILLRGEFCVRLRGGGCGG